MNRCIRMPNLEDQLQDADRCEVCAVPSGANHCGMRMTMSESALCVVPTVLAIVGKIKINGEYVI